MVAGGPGDHPLTDVINFNRVVYGKPADNLLRELARWLSPAEMNEFWHKDIGWDCKTDVAFQRISQKLEWAKKRAKTHGWEQ